MKFRMVWMGPDDPDQRPSASVKSAARLSKTVRYEQHGAEMVRVERLANGATRSIPVANFSARVVGDITLDDGLDESRHIALEVAVDGRMVRIVLGTAEFSRMSWVLHKLGPRAIVYPGQQQHTRAAIQSLSGEIQQEHIFAHLGWRKHRQNWVYLQSGEVVSAEGPKPDLRVRLSDPLKRFQTRQPTDAAALLAAVRSSLAFLSVAPDRITIPLLASVYRAPLGPVDFSLYLAGRTGTFKTALAALSQQHFGAAMNAAHLPANFASTASAIEEIAFEAKDSLLVIDDFVPSGRSTDDTLQSLAERIFRAAGNRQGRSRMSGQGLRAARPPRAFLLATGEEVPQGHSVRARLLIVELRPGDVDRAALTRSQSDAEVGQFATSMGGYLAWVAGRYEELQGRLKTRILELRQRSLKASIHARLPEMIAELASGWEIFLNFAVEAGAIPSDARTELEQKGTTGVRGSVGNAGLLSSGERSRSPLLEPFAGGARRPESPT